MEINLFFMNPVSYGGHVTFTVHLMRGLRRVGYEPKLWKVGNRCEGFDRKFGYDEMYRNVDIVEACRLAKEEPTLITAPSKPMAARIDLMLEAGARIVIHDPAEFKHGWNWKSVQRPIVIRTTMKQYFKNAVFIKHPYDAYYPLTESSTGKHSAVSTSRIDFDKHTEILLDANRLLAKRDQILIKGFENRIYTRFNILPKYPEWVQSVAAYPKELRYATQLCHDYRFMCDMSIIKGDGGGTQYTFLEAIDGGACCVLNNEWIIKRHTMKPGTNCLAVSSGKELASLIKAARKDPSIPQEIALRAKSLLKKHRAVTEAKKFAEEILR